METIYECERCGAIPEDENQAHSYTCGLGNVHTNFRHVNCGRVVVVTDDGVVRKDEEHVQVG